MIASFSEFFFDVHGYKPFPWQNRLAAQLIETHKWPDLIDLPTASGKTACIDIAVYHLAWCAHQGVPWKAARRIGFVIDRRIVVDSAAERGAKLCAALAERRTVALRSVTDALQKLGGGRPLEHFKLRGGMAKERSFATDPAQPMIITSTVDQIGSRLLFRGYGVSQYSQPIHAGLLAFDTLLLVDEAHLSTPFLATVAAIQREQARAERSLGRVSALRVVPLSATASTKGTPFRVDAEDLANDAIRNRRTAPKPAELIEVSAKETEKRKALIRHALDLYRTLDIRAAAVAIVVNRVSTARALFQGLQEDAAKRDFDVELLIGRSRPLDRDEVARRVLARVGVGREKATDERGLIVVATQTIEVGADLDFNGLVTECASLDALRQRFGRLDRLGMFRKAKAVIIGSPGQEDDPVYGGALSQTWQWLQSISVDNGAGKKLVDFSIEAMENALQGVDAMRMVQSKREPLNLTALHVDLLCQTSPSPMIVPDVAALLHGIQSEPPEVQVVWREEIPVWDGVGSIKKETVGICRALLELNPPSSLEAMPLPLRAVVRWLCNHNTQPEIADQEGVRGDDSGDVKQVEWERPVLRRSADGWEYAFARDIQPGDTIVVPASYGGCDQYGFAPEKKDKVTDLSAPARAALRKSPLLIITEQRLANHVTDEAERRNLWTALSDAYQAESEQADLLKVVIEKLPAPLLDGDWLNAELIIDVILHDAGDLYAIVLSPSKTNPGDISDEDLSSSRTRPIALADHNAGVGKKARFLAELVSLDSALIADVGLAGELHDLGKADPRFQALLRAGDDDVLSGQLLAKGYRRRGRFLPKLGERHEAYSVALVRQQKSLLSRSSDADCVLYLIGVHHGRGRSLMPDVEDEGASMSVPVGNAVIEFHGSPGLGAIGSGWSELFWKVNRRYGAWGVAYLEALVRLADWLRSAEELQGRAE